jgi:hypothetical protein
VNVGVVEEELEKNSLAKIAKARINHRDHRDRSKFLCDLCVLCGEPLSEALRETGINH